MSQQELLKTVIQVLDRVGIPYMLTGSIVSSLQGEPRSTQESFMEDHSFEKDILDILPSIQNG